MSWPASALCLEWALPVRWVAEKSRAGCSDVTRGPVLLCVCVKQCVEERLDKMKHAGVKQTVSYALDSDGEEVGSWLATEGLQLCHQASVHT